MSTNQSFIKAYRQDEAEPLRDRPAGLRRQAAAVAPAISATPDARARIHPGELLTPHLASTVVFVSPTLTAEPEAAVSTETRRIALPTRPGPANFSEAFPVVEPRPTDHSTAHRIDQSAKSVKRPLSAYIRRNDPTPATRGQLRPGTTIASLQWPTVCRQLIARHGQAFERVANRLLAQADAGRPLVGIIGHYRRVGCTTATLCLAAQLARRHHRVAAVEAHFQAPQFADCLGVETTAWLQDVLDDVAPLADAMIHAEDDQLDLVMLDPCQRTVADDWQRAASGPQLIAAAQSLRNNYDLVLVDLGTFFDPAWQPVALNLVRELRIESAVAVTAPDQNDERDFETIEWHLKKSDCELLGTIINRTT